MKTELINLVFEYDKNRNTPEREECWNKLIKFLKENKCTESNLELEQQIKDLVKEFHKLSKLNTDIKVKVHNLNVNQHYLPKIIRDSEERYLETNLQKHTSELNKFLKLHGELLINTLLKELEIKTAEGDKK